MTKPHRWPLHRSGCHQRFQAGHGHPRPIHATYFPWKGALFAPPASPKKTFFSFFFHRTALGLLNIVSTELQPPPPSFPAAKAFCSGRKGTVLLSRPVPFPGLGVHVGPSGYNETCSSCLEPGTNLPCECSLRFYIIIIIIKATECG